MPPPCLAVHQLNAKSQRHDEPWALFVSNFQCSPVGQFSKLNYRVVTTTIGVFNSPFQWIGCNPLALIRPSFRPKTTKSAQKISWKSRLSPLKTEKSQKAVNSFTTLGLYAFIQFSFACRVTQLIPRVLSTTATPLSPSQVENPDAHTIAKSKWRYDRICSAYNIVHSQDEWLLSRKARSWRICLVETDELTSIPPSGIFVLWSGVCVVGSSLPLLFWEAWELLFGSVLPFAFLAAWRWTPSALLSSEMASAFRHCWRSTCWCCCFVEDEGCCCCWSKTCPPGGGCFCWFCCSCRCWL